MSHFTVLTAMEAPALDEPTKAIPHSDPAFAIIMRAIGKSTNRTTSIDFHVENALEGMMAPFCESAEEPEYTEFYEQDEHGRYQNDTINIIIMPNGTRLTSYDYAFNRKYMLEDGVVYQRFFGR